MNLFVDFSDKPIVVGTRTPRFSWHAPFDGRSNYQRAYRVKVATSASAIDSGHPDMWDSGTVDSRQSTSICYGGKPLESNTDYFWSVTVWDDAATASEHSQTGTFSTPLFESADWVADWIGMGSPDEPCSKESDFQRGSLSDEVKAFEPDPRSPMMRKALSVAKPIRRARAYVCGVGFHEFSLNGETMGNGVLSTPRTDYRQRVLYNTYDVTNHLVTGENVIGLMLGNSWFNGQKKYWGWQHQWFGSPRVIFQLEITFEDGSTETLVSDETWQGDWSPITANCVYDGETYDARLEQAEWNTAGFNAETWERVNVVPSPGGNLAPMAHDDEMITKIVQPVSINEPEPGVYVVDLGTNMTGWVRLRMTGGERGDTIKFHYGEAQYDDGSLNSSSNNAALQTDTYIMKGAAEEVYEPRFTFHGFQFVEITGLSVAPTMDDIHACFVRTAVGQTGSFECASDLINAIHRCTLQSQLCNVQLGVPTDDTQRPERLGWGADAWGTANQALYNLWMPRVYEKWIGDIRDQQHDCGMVGMIAPQSGSGEDLVWSAAFLIIPWLTYQHSGDTRILEESYSSLQRYVEFLQRCGAKEVSTMTTEEALGSILWGCDVDARFPAEADRGHLQLSQWGDHLCTNEGFLTRSNQPISVATAFYYLDVTIMTKIARVLGHESDADMYGALAADIKEAFNERFFDEKVGYYDTGIQSAQAWPLVFGLVPDDQRERVQTYLASNVGERQRRLTTGYVGTKFAIQALAEAGRNDIVWKLATATTYPSWGYMLSHNRTTSCERWDGEKGSLNHAPLGSAIDEWFYWGLAGIQPDETRPGYEHVIFRPYIPDDLEWASASIQTMRGTVKSAWRRQDNSVTLEVTVPGNSSATVYLPTAAPDEITESGNTIANADGISLVESTDAETILTMGSGTYRFAFT